MKELVFLKLGGSLITDKTQPYTPLLDVMDDLALQVATALRTHPNLRLVLGHGAGSFGHVPASEYKTRDGLPPKATQLIHRERDESEDSYWKGFAEVWYQASSLNRFVMKALHNRSEEHTSELQSHSDLVCRLLLEKKKTTSAMPPTSSMQWAKARRHRATSSAYLSTV